MNNGPHDNIIWIGLFVAAFQVSISAKDKLAGSIFGYVANTLILLLGLSLYSSGTGYMTFAGIPLPEPVFVLLCALWYVQDTFQFIKAVHAEKTRSRQSFLLRISENFGLCGLVTIATALLFASSSTLIGPQHPLALLHCYRDKDDVAVFFGCAFAICLFVWLLRYKHIQSSPPRVARSIVYLLAATIGLSVFLINIAD